MQAVLSLTKQPVLKQIIQLKRGLPSNTLSLLSKRTGLSEAMLIDRLDLKRRTASYRKQSGKRFTSSESERMLRVAKVYEDAQIVFATKEAITIWLNQKDFALGDNTPLEMLSTDLGAREVDNLVQAMIHGVPL